MVEDIIKSAAGKVNEYFSNLEENPFNVLFGEGLYTQTGNDIKVADLDTFSFIWMMSPYDIDRTNPEFNGVYQGDIVIGVSTKSDYTQEQRNQLSYNAVLTPIYERFLYELGLSAGIHTNYFSHRLTKAPFWGLGDVGGQNAKNIWKTNADCLIIKNLTIKILQQYDSCAKLLKPQNN